jgi:arsenite methyltransferase
LRLQLGRLPRTGEEGAIELDLKDACASAYSSPAIQWLLGGELHPGGERTTRRALELIELRTGERLLDVASGTGSSAILAVREFGCVAAGLEYSPEAVRAAQEAADAAGLCDFVGFVEGDAEELPFADGSFDAVLCECSLCTFPDKLGALREIRRVLRPGGRLALSDVVADRPRLPPELEGALATVACVGEALSTEAYRDLLTAAGLCVAAIESRDADADALAERVHDRLRGSRILGLDSPAGSPIGVDDALELVAAARRMIAEGALGYAIVTATR